MINAEKIWFDDAPNKRVVDEKIIFFGKVRIVRKQETGGDFGMMVFNPVDDAWIKTLEINFRVTIAFEIFFERSEHSSAIEGNIRMLGGF